MELMKYIGFQLDEIRPVLDNANIRYEVVETFDTKRTILGDECRILNFRSIHEGNDDTIRIYVAYF